MVAVRVDDDRVEALLVPAKLLDEIKRRAGETRRRHDGLWIDRLDRPIGRVQDLPVFDRVGIAPEALDVRLVPDLPVLHATSVPLCGARDEFCPFPDVLLGWPGPVRMRSIRKHRERLESAGLQFLKGLVIAREVPCRRIGPRLGKIQRRPHKAYPCRLQQGDRLRESLVERPGIRRRAHAVRIVRPSRGLRRVADLAPCNAD